MNGRSWVVENQLRIFDIGSAKPFCRSIALSQTKLPLLPPLLKRYAVGDHAARLPNMNRRYWHELKIRR
jgi:hypothetical protein